MSRILILYNLIILILYLYSLFHGFNINIETLDLQFNINDNRDPKMEINYILEPDPDPEYEIIRQNFDKYTVGDINEILDGSKKIEGKSPLEKKLGTVYFWAHSGSKLSYKQFVQIWKAQNTSVRHVHFKKLRRSIGNTIDYHNGDTNKALPDIIKILKLRDPNLKIRDGIIKHIRTRNKS